MPSSNQDSGVYTQSQNIQQSQEFGNEERRASFKLGDSSDSDFDDFFLGGLNKAKVAEGNQSQSQPSQSVDHQEEDDDDDDANLDEFFSQLS